MASLRDFKELQLGFWIMCLDCLVCYSLTTTRVVFGSDSLVHLFGHDQTSAGSIITVQYLVAAFVMPIIGTLADKRGKIIRILFFGAFLQLTVQTI
jgi:MFS family permease